MAESIIYVIRNKTNGKVYIGQTIQGLARRQSEHKYRFALGERDHKLYEAFRKHGFENFEFDVLLNCNSDELDNWERFFIAAANSYNRGYNMTCGGDGVSVETRAKLSAILKGRKVTWIDKAWITRRKNPNAAHPADHVKSGAENSNSRGYLVKCPDGSEVRFKGLRAFCKERGLSHNLLIATLNGTQHHHKGYVLLARFNDHPDREYSQAAGNGTQPVVLAG